MTLGGGGGERSSTVGGVLTIWGRGMENLASDPEGAPKRKVQTLTACSFESTFRSKRLSRDCCGTERTAAMCYSKVGGYLRGMCAVRLMEMRLLSLNLSSSLSLIVLIFSSTEWG